MEVTEVDRKIASKLGNAQVILDVGCGEGRLTWHLAQQTGREIIGVDLSRSGFEKAKNLAYKAGVGHLVQCVKGNACHLNFPNSQFDMAILSYTLHHVEDPPAALREVRRVLRLGGTIVVSEGERGVETANGHCERYTLSELTETLAEAGFGDIQWERVEGDVLLVATNKT